MATDNAVPELGGDGSEIAPPADVSRVPLDSFGQIGVPQSLKNMSGIVWRMLILLVGLLVFIKIISFLGGVAMALFFSMIVAALGGPMQRRLARIMPGALATIITLIFFLLLVSAILGFVVKSVVDQWGDLIASAQAGFTQVEDWLQTGPLHMDETAINSLLQSAQSWLTTEGTNFAKDIPSTLGSAGDFITAASVLAFGAFFFLTSGDKIWQWCLTWAPIQVRDEVDNAGLVTWGAIAGYTRGLIIVAFCDGVLVYIGLVVLHVPLAPVLAVVVMFGALIPVIGAPIATLFAAVVALATEGIVVALLVILLTIIVGSFDGDIMQPLIMGHAVQLHPLAIVSVIAVGTLSFGIVGALLAVPLTATVYSLAKYLTGRMPAPRDVPQRPRKPRIPGFIRRRMKRYQEDADTVITDDGPEVATPKPATGT